MKCVILAGGRGTRISELSKDIPKPMIQAAGQPLLVHIINIYKNYGINNVLKNKNPDTNISKVIASIVKNIIYCFINSALYS